jgi:hypothetical protein
MLRIAPRGDTVCNTRLGFFVHGSSGCIYRRTEISDEIEKNRNDLVRGALAPRGSDPKHLLPSEPSALSLLPLVGRATTVHFTGGGSGQPMQIAAKREGNTPFISPELDPTPHVLASTTITRSSSG